MSRSGLEGPVQLVGVLETAPGLVTVMPSQGQLEEARVPAGGPAAGGGPQRNAGCGPGHICPRGDGNDTPLGLPESLTHLVAWLDSR